MVYQRKGAAPAKELAPLHSTSSADSIASAPLYHPLAWRSAKPADRCRAKPDAFPEPDRAHRPRRIGPALIVFLVLAVHDLVLIWGAS